MSASRQRVTLWVRRLTPLCELSMMLVVARHFGSDGRICSRCRVNISFSPSRRLGAAGRVPRNWHRRMYLGVDGRPMNEGLQAHLRAIEGDVCS
jgi:hypothetical protein